MAAVVIAVLAYIYLNLRIADERDRITVEETHHVQIQAAVLSTDLRFIAHTLSFLHDQIQAHGFVESNTDRVSFAHDLYSFMRNNELFDQIRFIDATGMERLRVDAGRDGPVVVADQALQFKGDTYYFHKTMTLTAKEIYISPLDLNKEHGMVEPPLKPVIRFGMKVLKPDGKPAGVLMINHKAQDMLDRYRRVASPSDGIHMLLNTDGYWLSHPDPRKTWGFMFAAGVDLTMAKSAPEMWARIQRSESGQFEDQGSIISFASVHPFAAFSTLRYLNQSGQYSKRYWKVVSQFPASALEAIVTPIRNRVLSTVLLAWLLVSLLIAIIIRSRMSRDAYEHALRIRNRAIDEATAGIVICDMQQADTPIIYCNAAFETITGYARSEIIGCNSPFLQQHGDHDQAGIAEMHHALEKHGSCQVTLKNYRKDGSMFWNQLTLSPVHESDGTLSHYLGYLLDVTGHKQSEDKRAQLLKQVQMLSRDLMQAREMERADIARTLHDEFGQMLTAIQIQAQLSDQKCQARDCTAALGSIHRVEQFTLRLQETTRTVLQQLKPAHLEELGLFEAVKDLCQEWQHNAHFDVDFSVQGPVQHMPEQLNIQLFRIVQEGLTNIARHAKASQARICFRFKANRLVLNIEDNGCGLNLQQVVIGNGLTSMRERVHLLGGHLEVTLIPGGGSKLIFRIPVRKFKKNP